MIFKFKKMSQSRQLAAIMFTDIVEYTALMGRDEQKAFEYLNKNRQIQKPMIEQHNGRWIKELGDGVLASFSTVSDAVTAALKIQEACNAAKDFQLRIGIHLGEVVFEDADVFGDGVNVASRIQAKAPPGGIWVSEPVHNNVVNKHDIVTKYVTTESLKNVRDPVRIYQVVAEGLHVAKSKIPLIKANGKSKVLAGALSTVLILTAGYFIYQNLAEPGKKTGAATEETIDKSIAVLPFVDMSPGKDQEYFSDGLSQELMNLLSKIPGLKVSGRRSSFSFKDKNEDLRTIGEKLGVANVLEGSVQKEGSKIRVSAHLTRTGDGLLLWSDIYERDIAGIFLLYDDIAGAIAKQLKLKLFTSKDNKPSSITNTEVYNLILQGNYFAEKRDSPNLAKALDFYLKALEIDSSNARGWAGVAKCYSLQSTWQRVDRKQGYEKARSAATRSIELDGNQAEGHYVLGVVKMYDFNWDGANAEFQTAHKLDPGNADVLRLIGFLYQCKGQFDDAIRFTKQAITLDPVLAISHFTLSQHFYYSNQVEEAIIACKKALEINPQFPRANTFLGLIYLLQGKPAMAMDQLPNEPDKQWKIFGSILINQALGRKEEADKLLNNHLLKFPKDELYQIAEIYAYRGEKDKAFEYLEKSLVDREARLTYFKGDPLLKKLEKDPRYTAFLRKLNLPLD